jgi:hypothetical protein
MRKIGDTVFIERGSDGKCELCGAEAELRPYGPHDEWICCECGLKDKAGTEAKMDAIFEGSGEKPQ